jgi:hypothetical protein
MDFGADPNLIPGMQKAGAALLIRLLCFDAAFMLRQIGSAI